ncbi:MAG: hypothetical protein IJT63_05595 [Lachnospiraceae bacterium]|nr:hypothetical protein [Lachnospiraceae bacterium]
MYWLQSRDVSDPTDITYEILEEYYKNDEHISEASDARYTYATGDILIFMADNGMCHHALGWYPYFRIYIYPKGKAKRKINKQKPLYKKSYPV